MDDNEVKKWWEERPLRLIQTNLREIDADMDLSRFVQSLQDFSADVVLFNAGGIVANYPTKLKYHYINPYLKGDLLGEVLGRVHKEGIRLIARFDFSKVNEIYGNEKIDWLYKSANGGFVNYNGQLHTCVTGYYQQQYSFKILEEVMDLYPIDGIFFNMIGFTTTDYSGVRHGICQCDNCRRLFRERYGENLPIEENSSDPVFRKYEEFKRQVSRELFNRMKDFVKSKSENIALCTYTHEGVDIYRKESNTALARPLPEWNHSAGENVKTVMGSWDSIKVSNSAVHFVDYPARHSAVPPALTENRIAQNIANAGWLDYYVIGTLDNQDDRICFNDVKRLFRFHKENVKYFTGVKPAAEVCLVVPAGSFMYGSANEFKGLYRMLSQVHMLFDVMHDSVLESENLPDRLMKYQTVILPDVRSMGNKAAEALDRYVASGGKLLATGFSSTCDIKGDPMNRVRMNCAGIHAVKGLIEHQKGRYFRVRNQDKQKMKGFEDLDIVYLDGDLLDLEVNGGCESFLGLIPSSMFGPPEKCYYSVETDIPGIIVNKYGKGMCAFIPWLIGRHYEKRSNHCHGMLMNSVLKDLLGMESRLATDASPLVEITNLVREDRQWQIVCCVNHSGQLGTAFHRNIPVHDISIRLKTEGRPGRVVALVSGKELDFAYSSDGGLSFSIPELELLEAVVISKE